MCPSSGRTKSSLNLPAGRICNSYGKLRSAIWCARQFCNYLEWHQRRCLLWTDRNVINRHRIFVLSLFSLSNIRPTRLRTPKWRPHKQLSPDLPTLWGLMFPNQLIGKFVDDARGLPTTILSFHRMSLAARYQSLTSIRLHPSPASGLDENKTKEPKNPYPCVFPTAFLAASYTCVLPLLFTIGTHPHQRSITNLYASIICATRVVVRCSHYIGIL